MKKHVSDLAELIVETKKDSQNGAFICSLGTIKKETAEAIRMLVDLDLEDYEHIADSYFLRHVWANHLDEIREIKRGLTPILPSDFFLLPAFFETPDLLTHVFEKGKLRFIFEKTIAEKQFTYVAEARIGKAKTICAVTLFARPKKRA